MLPSLAPPCRLSCSPSHSREAAHNRRSGALRDPRRRPSLPANVPPEETGPAWPGTCEGNAAAPGDQRPPASSSPRGAEHSMDPQEVTAYEGESALTVAATRISSEPEEHKSDAEIVSPAPAFHDFWFL